MGVGFDLEGNVMGGPGRLGDEGRDDFSFEDKRASRSMGGSVYDRGPQQDQRRSDQAPTPVTPDTSPTTFNPSQHINTKAIATASAGLGTVAIIEKAKKALELSATAKKFGLQNPTHLSIHTPKNYTKITGKPALPVSKVMTTPPTLPAAWLGFGVPLMLHSSSAQAPTTGATNEEMLSLQGSLPKQKSPIYESLFKIGGSVANQQYTTQTQMGQWLANWMNN